MKIPQVSRFASKTSFFCSDENNAASDSKFQPVRPAAVPSPLAVLWKLTLFVEGLGVRCGMACPCRYDSVGKWRRRGDTGNLSLLWSFFSLDYRGELERPIRGRFSNCLTNGTTVRSPADLKSALVFDPSKCFVLSTWKRNFSIYILFRLDFVNYGTIWYLFSSKELQVEKRFRHSDLGKNCGAFFCGFTAKFKGFPDHATECSRILKILWKIFGAELLRCCSV